MNEGLLEISRELKKINSRAEKISNSLAEQLETDAIKIECNLDNGYYFRVTLKVRYNFILNYMILFIFSV